MCAKKNYKQKKNNGYTGCLVGGGKNIIPLHSVGRLVYWKTSRERALETYQGLVGVTAQATFAKALTCYERHVQEEKNVVSD